MLRRRVGRADAAFKTGGDQQQHALAEHDGYDAIRAVEDGGRGRDDGGHGGVDHRGDGIPLLRKPFGNEIGIQRVVGEAVRRPDAAGDQAKEQIGRIREGLPGQVQAEGQVERAAERVQADDQTLFVAPVHVRRDEDGQHRARKERRGGEEAGEPGGGRLIEHDEAHRQPHGCTADGAGEGAQCNDGKIARP